ncbi:MAG: SGNH/GDSL hydrolase family protein [Bacteroidales bacterium]|nr:SGNH/GDSL hydrolase family protein [Bacteroidales bacterium]
MKKKTLLLAAILAILSTNAFPKSKLVKNLKKNKAQTLIIYGTSISSMAPYGRMWVEEIGKDLKKKYGNKITLFNAGQSGQNSRWALENLQDSVLVRKPDAIVIDFATNDAVLRFDISQEECKSNTWKLVNRILEVNPNCEIYLHTPCGYPLGEGAVKRPKLKEYNQIYKTISQEKKLVWIDESELFAKMAKEKGIPELQLFVGDGVHPTQRGALEILYPNVLRAIIKGN